MTGPWGEICKSAVIATLVSAAQTGEAPVDFAFRYESKGCRFETVDTFNSTYYIFGLGAPIRLMLTDAERATIFRAVSQARFFQLPPAVNEPDLLDTFEIRVRASGVQHTVLWRYSTQWKLTEPGQRLGKLHQTIVDVVRARSEIARFHQKEGGRFGLPRGMLKLRLEGVQPAVTSKQALSLSSLPQF